MSFWRAIGELFRKYFIAGLLVMTPLVGTIWILKIVVYSIEDFFLGLIPPALLPDRLIGVHIPGVGLVVTIVLLILVGLLTRLVLARQMIKFGEGLLARIPIGRGVYQGLKQLMQLFVGQSTNRFSRVVLVEFPQAGSHVYGFVTGELPVTATTPERSLYVFVPTTPNPTTGFLFLIPEAKTRPAGVSVDTAMKLIISGGLMAQPSGQTEGQR